MDIVSGVIWRVKLDDPINFGDIQPSSRYIRTEQYTRWSIAKLEECVGSFLLFLFTVQVEYRYVDIVEQLRVVFDRVAGRKEDNDLLLQILLEESKEEHETTVGFAHHVTLFEHLDCGSVLLLVDVDVEWSGTEGDSSEIGDFGGLRSRE